MDEITYEEKMKLIGRMTQSEIYEVLDEAQFHQMSTEEWLSSSWAEELRQRVMERN
jgi:hypothetical protein